MLPLKANRAIITINNKQTTLYTFLQIIKRNFINKKEVANQFQTFLLCIYVILNTLLSVYSLALNIVIFCNETQKQMRTMVRCVIVKTFNKRFDNLLIRKVNLEQNNKTLRML